MSVSIYLSIYLCAYVCPTGLSAFFSITSGPILIILVSVESVEPRECFKVVSCRSDSNFDAKSASEVPNFPRGDPWKTPKVKGQKHTSSSMDQHKNLDLTVFGGGEFTVGVHFSLASVPKAKSTAESLGQIARRNTAWINTKTWT